MKKSLEDKLRDAFRAEGHEIKDNEIFYVTELQAKKYNLI